MIQKHSEYYQQLLDKVFDKIQKPSAMVVGALGYGTAAFEGNHEFLQRTIARISEREAVFNQLPWQDYELSDAPHDYEAKFDIFYRGLIESGKITKLYVLPSHIESTGVGKEISYAQEADIAIEYIDG